MKDQIVLVGGGGHCESCIDVIEANDSFEIAGIVDVPEKVGSKVLGYSVIGADEDLEKLVKEYRFFLITIGQIKNPKPRINIYNTLKKMDVVLPTIISPFAHVSKHAEKGAGTIVMHNVVVNANAVIGNNCIINTGAIIEHGVHIGNNVHVSTGAVVNGNTAVGDNSFVGSNSVVRENIKIGKNVIIGCGLSIVKDIDEAGIIKNVKV